MWAVLWIVCLSAGLLMAVTGGLYVVLDLIYEATTMTDLWKTLRQGQVSTATLTTVLEALGDHPFCRSSPELAKQVAQFRLRLLSL